MALLALETKTMAKADPKKPARPKYMKMKWDPKIGHSGDLFYKVNLILKFVWDNFTEPTTFHYSTKLAKRKSYH